MNEEHILGAFNILCRMYIISVFIEFFDCIPWRASDNLITALRRGCQVLRRVN